MQSILRSITEIMAVANVVALPEGSVFYSSYTGLESFIGVFMAVLGLVLVLHGLSAAIHALGGQTEPQESGLGHQGGFG